MTDEILKHEESEDKPNKITVILADDHPLMRKAIKGVLDEQDDIDIVAEAGDGEEAVRLATELVPDAVVMDISMPKLNGLEATRLIKEKCPDIAILVLTVHSDNEHVFRIFEAGATGYLTKSAFGNEVAQALRTVVAGDSVLSPPILKQILKHAHKYALKPLGSDVGEKLTNRESDIFRLAARGMSNKDIASQLGISLRTVKGYLGNIFSKLEVSSRTEAVIAGFRSGIITLEDIE